MSQPAITAFTHRPMSEVPCSTCDAPSIGCTSWPDGAYVAWCPEHEGAAQQVKLEVE
jgi:hypothetical protein